MRRLLLLPLLLLTRPAFAQGNCSDGTTGALVSLDLTVDADTLTACFRLEGDPNETLRDLGIGARFSGADLAAPYDEAIPPGSPYAEPPYETAVFLIPDETHRNYFYPAISGGLGPYLPFSTEPLPFLCPRFVLRGPLDEAALEIVHVEGTQENGSPISVCPPEDQGGFGVFVANEPPAQDRTLALHAPRPNPARHGAALSFTLAAPGPARLAVYDALGREVAVLVDETRAAGRHDVTFAPAGLPGGTYLVRLDAGGQVAVRRLTLVR